MNKQEILDKLKKLDINKKNYIIIAGASLVLQDIIDTTKDIDLACSNDIYDNLNWVETFGFNNNKIKVFDSFEIGMSYYSPKDIVKVNNYQCMSLEACLKLKRMLNRPKDKKIINKLDLILGSKDNYRYEKDLINKGITLIGGVDEVGRGPLCGPVVAACVILPVNYHLDGLTDSKKLSEKKRNEYYDIIMRDAISIGIGEISAKTIDEVNIYEASKLAMISAINNMKIKPEYLLIDAMKLDINIPQISIIKGDFLSESIAAASVIAKVTRDNLMYELDKKYPCYEFAKHKGYPTKKHIELIKKYGVLDNYSFTFSPVCDLINKDAERSEKYEVVNK